MSLIRYTPYLRSNLQQQIQNMLDQFDNDPRERSEGLGGGMFAPAVDVKEDTDAYVVHMEVPGVEQSNLNITLQENVLLIRGQKTQKEEHTEGHYRRVERSYGSFARSITLPRSVAGSGVTANLNDGVLEVRLPKHAEAKPRQISVGVTRPEAPETGAGFTGAESPGAQTAAPREGDGGAAPAGGASAPGPNAAAEAPSSAGAGDQAAAPPTAQAIKAKGGRTAAGAAKKGSANSQ